MIANGFHFKIIFFIAVLCDVNAAVVRKHVTRSTSTKNFLLDLLSGGHNNLIVILDADVLSPKPGDYDEDDEVDTVFKTQDYQEFKADTGVKTFDASDDESDDDWLENNDDKDSTCWLHHLLRSTDDDESDDNDSKLYLRAALRKRCDNLNKCKKKCPKKKKPCENVCESLIDKENLCDDKPKKCDKCDKKKCDICGKMKCDKCGKCKSECQILDYNKYWNEF